MGGFSNCVTYPTCGSVYTTFPMYSSSVIGKSVPGIDAGFASPFVLSVLGSSSITETTLCTITLSWSDGRLNTIISPFSTFFLPDSLF